MRLNRDDFETLRVMRGNALESQRIRATLREVGLKFCGVCVSIKATDAFGRDRQMKDGKRCVCRRCDASSRRHPRARKGMVYFMFNGAERNQRHRDSRTPEELQAIYDASNAQRDTDNYRRWYTAYSHRIRNRHEPTHNVTTEVRRPSR